MATTMVLRSYCASDEEAVVALWKDCGLTRPWNDPRRDIARKLTQQPELFVVGTLDEVVMATAMMGYEGHRGWINYLAVAPAHQRRGYARQLMDEAERALTALGCPKLNLQVRATNAQALGFYRALGYVADDVISMGKRLIPDE